jgi:hypothetical protein
MAAGRRLNLRLSDRHGELAAVFRQAAADLGGLLADAAPHDGGAVLAAALANDPQGWSAWLPALLEHAPSGVAAAALRQISERRDADGAWIPLIRRLADVAGEVDAFRATFSDAALKQPSIAAEVARRLLAVGRVAEAGRLLQGVRPGASPGAPRGRATPDVDFDWETVWIDYLETSGQLEAAQAARWASFERTLAPARAKAFTARLRDFDDVEAEQRAFAYAAAHPDFARGLLLLMEWPALAEAARMIDARSDEVDVTPEQAETWAAQLRARYPAAASRLLRSAAAAAFRRRELKTCHRLTDQADAIGL